MNSSILRLFSLIFLAITLTATAQQNLQPESGKILGLTGSASILLPGSASPMPATAGQSVPEGSRITTTDGSSVMVGLTAGAATLVEGGSDVAVNQLQVRKSGSRITHRSINLEVTQGSALSFLKSSDSSADYSVRTPIGVAAARGTIWRSGSDSIQVIDGVVSVTLPDGTVVSVPAGKQMTPDGKVDVIDDAVLQTLADAIAANTKLNVNLSFLDDGTAQIVITNAANEIISSPSFNPVTNSDSTVVGTVPPGDAPAPPPTTDPPLDSDDYPPCSDPCYP